MLQVKPLVVPEQVPTLYFPLTQFWLEHVEQAVFEVPEHAPLVYWPKAHVLHALHWNPFVAPLQDPLRYFPFAQFWLEQMAHAVFEVPEHVPLVYWPPKHEAHVLQVKPLVVPAQVPALYWLLPQFTFWQSLQENPFEEPLQDPMRYFPLAQFWLEHVTHAVSEVPEQPPLLY